MSCRCSPMVPTSWLIARATPYTPVRVRAIVTTGRRFWLGWQPKASAIGRYPVTVIFRNGCFAEGRSTSARKTYLPKHLSKEALFVRDLRDPRP